MAWDAAIRTHATLLADRWCALILATYPPAAARRMAGRSDPFANPVGGTIRRATRAILRVGPPTPPRAPRPDALPVAGPSDESPAPVVTAHPFSALADALHDIVRVRAVQDFSPSQAVGFVFLLKQAARDAWPEGASPLDPSDLAHLDRWTDDLALLAFDLYTADRERIAQIRVSESRRAVGRLLERAGFPIAGPDENTEAIP